MALAGIAVVFVIGIVTPATLAALASFVWPHAWVWHDVGLARCVVLACLVLASIAWLLFVVDFVADVVPNCAPTTSDRLSVRVHEYGWWDGSWVWS